MNRKLRMGMVGGGTDAFIGAIHRLAALMDNQIELVCGCFSVNPKISKESGKLYYLPENRVYSTCLLYTSDAADDLLCVDLGGRRIIKKKNSIYDQKGLRK